MPSAIEHAPRMRLRTPAELTEAEASLFTPPGADLFASRLWFDTIAAHAAPSGLHARCAIAGPETAPVMLMPVWCRANGGLKSALSSPYTLEYRPIFSNDESAGMAGHAFGRLCRWRPEIRLDALDPGAPWLAAFIAGVRAAGLLVQRFDHFGNWHENVAGFSFADYLTSRPGALRSTVRRKLKAAEKAARFEMICSGPALEPGIAAFEAVYAESWKQPEPFPRFNAALMRALAGAGLLRLGVLYAETKPIAAQYWTISGGRAVLHKLAHDESALALSPGTVLTALMIRALLDGDTVVELDFGRGDDPYKQNWAGRRQQRTGILLTDPRHPAGLARVGIAALGKGRRRLRTALGRNNRQMAG